MQFHLDGLIAENVAAGVSAEEARYAAMRAFGNATVANEQTLEVWGWTWLERLLQDLREMRGVPGCGAPLCRDDAGVDFGGSHISKARCGAPVFVARRES
jgi:hypothetical protein